MIATDNPGSPNLAAQLLRLPPNFDLGGTLGVVQTFNRLAVTVKGTFDRNTYYNSVLPDGETSSNGDRNFNQWAGIMRVGYELDPGLRPFIEIQEDERHHDLQFDRNGLERSSVGTTGKIGAVVDLFGSVTGEMAVGYTQRDYKDPTLPNIAGTIVNGALIWQATPLTTAKFNASSQVYETILAGTTGTLTRDVNLQVDHAFLLWLIGTLKAGYGTDDYVGSTLSDRRYFLAGGLTYSSPATCGSGARCGKTGRRRRSPALPTWRRRFCSVCACSGECCRAQISSPRANANSRNVGGLGDA
jgi:hypothetical protein